MIAEFSVVSAYHGIVAEAAGMGGDPDSDVDAAVTDASFTERADALVSGYGGPAPDPVATLLLAEEFMEGVDEVRETVVSPEEWWEVDVIDTPPRPLAAAAIHSAALLVAGHDTGHGFAKHNSQASAFTSSHLANVGDVARDSVTGYYESIPRAFVSVRDELPDEVERRSGVTMGDVHEWVERNAGD